MEIGDRGGDFDRRLALPYLMEQVFVFFTEERRLPPVAVAESQCRDAQRSVQTELPAAERRQFPAAQTRFSKSARPAANATTRRQNRHRGVG